jgi:hypothetical protein
MKQNEEIILDFIIVYLDNTRHIPKIELSENENFRVLFKMLFNDEDAIDFDFFAIVDEKLVNVILYQNINYGEFEFYYDNTSYPSIIPYFIINTDYEVYLCIKYIDVYDDTNKIKKKFLNLKNFTKFYDIDGFLNAKFFLKKLKKKNLTIIKEAIVEFYKVFEEYFYGGNNNSMSIFRQNFKK